LSSILRALKKLENEPRHLGGSQHLDSKFVPSADIGKQRTVSTIFIMVVGGSIVCGLVILAGWWLFSEKFQSQTIVPPKISQLDSRLDESPTPSQNLNNAPIRAVAEEKSKETLETQKTVEQVREPEPASLEKPDSQIIGQENALPAEEQTPEKTVAPSGSTPVTPVKTITVEIPKLNDPDMKLQAITWSRVPQKRIAVINSRILREGEMVSGYLINTINQDDIVLSQEGAKWKLLFR